MSDRMTNVEIEDVLTSIRRLVMEGGAANPAERVVPDRIAASPARVDATDRPQGQTAAPQGKFVLTPAFRVAEPTPLFPAASVPPETGPVDDALSRDILPDAELTSEDVSGADFSGFEQPAPSDFIDLGPEPDIIPVPQAPDRRLRLADTVAGLEAAVTAQTDDWEPDGSEDIPVMDWSHTTADDAPVFRSRHTGLLRSAVVVDDDGPVDTPTFRHSPRFEPDTEVDDPDGVARFEAIAEEPMDDDLAAFIGAGSVMDEGQLRALVMEIVRQELQGKLGERITSNVRKLVRREIARAMTTAEYD